MRPSTLSQPVTFFRSGVTSKNRLMKSAMTEELCRYDPKDLDLRGRITPEYEQLYKVWGQGNIGILVLGNIPISRHALEAKGNAIIERDSAWDAVESFRPAITAAKAHGSICLGQLTHGGRQTPYDIMPEPVSSSSIAIPNTAHKKYGTPRPLSIEEIDDLVDRWGYAAEVLAKAGADGCQIHAAHGFLVGQFLSSRVNKRTDNYGGSLVNKSRLLFRIIEEVKARTPCQGFVIAVKINCSDLIEDGITDDECLTLCPLLEEAGVDLIELSGGTQEGVKMAPKQDPGKAEPIFAAYGRSIHPTLQKALLAVTAGNRSAQGMAAAIDQGVCDVIGLGRPLCADPFFCDKILKGEIQAAPVNHISEPLTTQAAIRQIHCIAAGQPIPDLSDKKVAQELENLIKT